MVKDKELTGCVDTAQVPLKWLHRCVKLPSAVFLFKIILLLQNWCSLQRNLARRVKTDAFSLA